MRINWKYSFLAAILLLPFFYSMWFTFPAGDDFMCANLARYPFDLYTSIQRMGWEWWTWSGRYTYHFLSIFVGDAATTRSGYALVCTGVALVYFTALLGIFRELCEGRHVGNAVFFALVCLLTVFAGHRTLSPTYYLITDALTLGLGNGLVLLFIWALCRVWFAETVTRGATLFAIVSGAAAIGCYEHSAIATLLAAATAVLLAHVYDHRHRSTFRLIFKFIAGFFLVSFLARGNFRRQTKRNVTWELMLEHLLTAGKDWFVYSFWGFTSVFPLTALFVSGMIRPRWKVSLAARISALRVFLLGGILFFILSAGIVLVHALSDVTVGDTPKLPASIGLLTGYILGFVALACGDPLRRRVGRIPVWLPSLALLAILAATDNVQRAVTSVLSGETAAYGATQERRFSVLRESAGHSVEVARLDIHPFPASTGEAIPGNPEAWPSRHIRRMFGLTGVQSTPLSPSVALEDAEASKAIHPTGLQVPPFSRTDIAFGVRGGPNRSYDFDWLLLSGKDIAPDTVVTVLEIPEPGGERLIPVALQRWLDGRVLSQEQVRLGWLERLAGFTRTFELHEWRVQPLPSAATEYALPVHNPAAGGLRALYVSTDGTRFQCAYRRE
ncbi:hypothetical protein dsx2_3280 [Desulfovibrio sp. X2]|uniref:hypothetical protein n=1 Tax=Desulfovibrio sp. X2 TaxID=941449 RepID=UPI000358EBF4|nr:hypothetical protein [Desulfovibrio sp. X2]EPR40840.1 hypothetical protein dsx2_3280 [Desulfovibrio sp. X2]